MPVDPAGLIDAEMQTALVQMAQAITIKAQVNRQDVQRENQPVRSMADRLRDFTRMKPLILRGSKTSEDPQKFMDEVQKILVVMGDTDTKKVELASYQLKDVAHTWCKMSQDSPISDVVPVT